MRWITVPLLVAAAALVACGRAPNVDVRLHQDRSWLRPDFPPRPEDAPVELWVGETSRPKIEIAIISSTRTAERSREAREAQLDELRQRARRLGAHAVENLRVETAEVSGFVADPRVPFTAFKQDDFELYYVRGTAVLYLDAENPPRP